MLKLWSYSEDFGRMGSLSGIFIMSEEKLNQYRGKSFYWDELLGKHSEGHHTLDDTTLVDLEVPEEIVKVLFDRVGTDSSGCLDFEYFSEQLEEMEDE